MGVCSIKQKSLAFLIALIMVLGISPLSAFAAEGDSSDEEYKYVYAGLTWAEYWKSEGVYLSGDDWEAAVDELDSSDNSGKGKSEYDLGAYDAVSRATTNHGIHRGSFQCSAIIYDEEGNSYAVSHWNEDGSVLYLTDGTSVGFSRGTITRADGTTASMKNYEVTGIKFVPVKVKTSDYEAFAKKYSVVENGETLAGGYGEQQLKAFSKTADVTENTNGLKTATKDEKGNFVFSKRQTGTDSGLKDESQKTVDESNLIVTVKPTAGVGTYGEFLRVDFTGSAYGDLGANMQAVRWNYYGNDESRSSEPIASYGTKFAADNWMHKSNGIQLGLTESLRCKLPEGTDGTGYWTLTVYALGYADYTVNIDVTADNLKAKDEEAPIDLTALKSLVDKANTLKESDYTATSWKIFKAELDEAEDMLKAPGSQASENEAIAHLTAAMDTLEQAPATSVKVESIGNAKVSAIANKAYTGKAIKPSVTVKLAGKTLKKGTDYTVTYKNNTNPGKATISIKGKGNYAGTKAVTFKITPKKATVSKLTSTKKATLKVTWKKDTKATGYQVVIAKNKKFTSGKKSAIITKNKTTSKTFTKLTKGKKYYAKVRAYKTISGKKVYGAYSAVKSKTVKKK
ncbi:hypothetical protein LI177_13750 [bacterium 210820-DFI.6.37]|nr:hypothetical protein [bacterium 210820-DFI.6.37]